MRKRNSIFTLFLATMLLVSSCWVSALAVVSKIDSTDFSLKLFRLSTKDKKENVVVSPYSIQSALSMALTGAEGQTKSEMLTLFGASSISPSAVAEAYEKVSNSFSSLNPATQFRVANAIFASKTITLKKTFVASNLERFGAKAESLDFANSASLQKINDWVKAQTNGRIPSILDRLSPDMALCLVNAVYFKSIWKDAFREDDTKEETFTLLDGSSRQVKQMLASRKMFYLKGEYFQAVRLPYIDERFQMFVFLPSKEIEFEKFKEGFTIDKWRQWMAIDQFRFRSGYLSLPRCKVEYKEEMQDFLSASGMPCAFNAGCADFSGITATKTYISKVFHKTFLEMNEKGTEAAAATAVEMGKGMTMVRRETEIPFSMVCDRPYVIALRDSSNDSILFIGAIVDPGDGS